MSEMTSLRQWLAWI